ncbi:LEAF RUST 10 DISEASE-RESISTANCEUS RECEPTOR-LIKE PROTEIN KINASE-like 2.1 [Medicago truncatula]|uniref:LEAF RUST 10 DISEASE-RESISTANCEUS RECEPTOR-LIKE PROTEIN KINASE-like 2.1 n=1 Tax=Medicago truncatula TaxID=3880 RepID=UPI001967FFAF|nr:LEAF RUST 10 DISEASE-RESISTANCE LOCUS RECEPTOR-LIKE PROTEIN KINASE-like 2.1 [Medicago truncatula]
MTLILLLPFTLLIHQVTCWSIATISPIEQEHTCPPSSCGKISNITYPFRLNNDPINCGDKRYELACENNVTTLNLYSGKYHVQSINYNNFTIRLVDLGVQQSNCSSIPLYSLSQSNFCDTYNYYGRNCKDPYHAVSDQERLLYPDMGSHELLFKHIVYLNCTHQVTNNPKYVNTSSCFQFGYSKSNYIYAMAGDLIAQDFQVGCHVKLVTPTSLLGLERNKLLSYDIIHKALVYGFEISWMHLSCHNRCGDLAICLFINSTSDILQCRPYCGSSWDYMAGSTIRSCDTFIKGLYELIKGSIPEYLGFANFKVGFSIGHYGIPSFCAARFLFGMTLFIALLIYKWKRSHLSTYECIEIYLQQQNNLMPIRYSYKEIKKMARGFKDKLGEGGFGTVFKGNLRSGPCVAIKMLGKSKGNGKDFISEVSTIGRIYHLNVVRLLGFCIEGSKRALVYEFMPNGSLDKFIFSKEGSVNISYSQIFDISVGVARGIAYLHHGCEMKILHFDIKPHNILLDENFTPKVSDFGLAKLYPVENSIVTMTAARGTIGYMAPELFYKNIGGVSYKADVYSFGMLLMEMAGKRKNLNVQAEHSSQLYFPLWIYDQFGQEGEIEIEDVPEDEKKIVKKMIIVALWCIQLTPDDRPSMSKVVEMLEGDVESLEMPLKPTLYPHETAVDNQRTNLDQTTSSDYGSSYDSVEMETKSLLENIA